VGGCQQAGNAKFKAQCPGGGEAMALATEGCLAGREVLEPRPIVYLGAFHDRGWLHAGRIVLWCHCCPSSVW